MVGYGYPRTHWSTRRRFTRSALWVPVSAVMLLGGCRADSWPVMDPGGAIALAERDLLLFVTGVTLIVVIPVFVLTVWVVTRYRAGDAEGPYRPNWTYSKRIDLGIWAVAGTVA
ncbi:MAG: hypothetical protein PVF40_07770, partial [Ectothiorhodospiraceae bacterium]